MAETRAMAHAIFEALLDHATQRLPPDEALAWISGLRGDPRHHWSEPTRVAINRARSVGLSWRRIAMATEGTDNEDEANRVQSKQRWRNQAWEDFQAGVGEFQVRPNGGMPSA